MRPLVLTLLAVTVASGAIGYSEAAGPASGIIKFVFWLGLVLLALGLVAHVSALWEHHDPHGSDDAVPPRGGPLTRT